MKSEVAAVRRPGSALPAHYQLTMAENNGRAEYFCKTGIRTALSTREPSASINVFSLICIRFSPVCKIARLEAGRLQQNFVWEEPGVRAQDTVQGFLILS